MSDGPHQVVAPAELGPASGFSHGIVAAPGATLHVAGQLGCDAAGAIVDGGLVEQLGAALDRVVRVLEAAGARPDDVVSMLLHTTAMAEYRAHTREVGAVWRANFGRHFPAMTMVAVPELVDPRALIEVTAVAVVPAAPRPRNAAAR